MSFGLFGVRAMIDIAESGSIIENECSLNVSSKLKRRANFLKWKSNWSSGSFSAARKKYTPNVKGVISTDGVKTRYMNDYYEVVYDNENNYFRVKDLKRNQYLDVDGKVLSNNANQNTHILNNDE